MKYYLYISDAKLDMLYPQVPHSVKKKVSTDVKVDLKLLGGSRKSEEETEENRMTKLDAVVRFIMENEDVGRVDADTTYLSEIIEMRWGIAQQRDRALGKRVATQTVSFGAMVGDIAVSLFGSTRHLLGASGTPQAADLRTTAGFESLFINIVEVVKTFEQDQTDAGGEDLKSNAEVLQQFALFTKRMSGPRQRLEFLAKRLTVGTALDGCRVVVGTPLYVALAD